MLLKDVQKKTIFSNNACVLILKGTYGEKYINPVIKVYKDQTEEDMKFILAEVSHPSAIPGFAPELSGVLQSSLRC